MNRVLNVTDLNFEHEVLRAPVPVLVDFWASWCPPCKMVEPVLVELEEALAGRIKIAKLQVDQNQQVASRYGIQGVPTFVLFTGGEPLATKVGAHSKKQLLVWLAEWIPLEEPARFESTRTHSDLDGVG